MYFSGFFLGFVRFLFIVMLVTLLVYVPVPRFIVSPLFTLSTVYPKLLLIVILVLGPLTPVKQMEGSVNNIVRVSIFWIDYFHFLLINCYKIICL